MKFNFLQYFISEKSQGEFVNEYVGELITYEETERRVKLARKNNVKDFYFLVLDKDR